MKCLRTRKRTLALVAVLIPLFVLFVYVALRSGPLAPVSVVLTTVEAHSSRHRFSASVPLRLNTPTRLALRLPDVSID